MKTKMSALIVSALAIVLENFQLYITNIISKIASTAESTLVLILGTIPAILMAALIADAICIMLNIAITPSSGGRTIGQIVARALGETMGGVAAAWCEGWASTTGKSQEEHRVEDKVVKVYEHNGLRLVDGEASPEFRSIVDVKPETRMVTAQQEKEEVVEDGELVENNWA